jgi:para-aminobenzoate synthetase component 1
MTFDLPDNIAETVGSLTGVRCEPADFGRSFIDLAAGAAHLPGTVALVSGGDLDCARYHILGLFPWLTLTAKGRRVQLQVRQQTFELNGDPLEVMRSIIERLRLPQGSWPPPVAAGMLGYFAYDLKDSLERLPRTSVDDLDLPDMTFYVPGLLVVHDKQLPKTHVMVPLQEGADNGEGLLADFRALLDAPRPPVVGRSQDRPMEADARQMRSNFSPEGYETAVGRIIDYIAAGDVYQVNLSQRFQVPFQGNGFHLFEQLYRRNPAPFFAFVHAGDHQIISTSPERFLMRDQDRVETRPIKGTRPRGDTPEQDRAMREELAASAKDDAELSMIVDLLRNDMGKVCAPGSVRVSEHKRLEAYRNVYHLVSVVEGTLDADKDSVDLVRACFPGGSITGCPKVRAMEIIDELESCRRHVYCGSIGYLSFHDTMDLSIAIRTATLVGDTLRFSVGGGVVYDSKPRAEYEETLHKGQTLMAACTANPAAAGEPRIWQNGHLLPQGDATVPVSDLGLQYGFGFFETLRLDDGNAPLLDAHIERFESTWRALMPSNPPDVTWGGVLRQVLEANDLLEGCAAAKILATRGSRNGPPWDHTLLVSARPYVHRLRTLGVDGLRIGTYPHPRQSPLAAHKTLNYLYYLQAGDWARQHGFHEALILNPDGTVSETNTANLLLVTGREVVQPLSSASLSGVMAGAVCRRLEDWGYTVSRRPVEPGMLERADQVLATNALMGAVPVHALDGSALPRGDDLWQRINDAVIARWRGGILRDVDVLG